MKSRRQQIDEGIAQAYSTWTGHPRTRTEIAQAAHCDPKVIRRTEQAALRKLQKGLLSDPEIRSILSRAA